jgi:hypothetical protein
MKRNLFTLVSSLTLLLCATSSLFAQDRNPPANMTFQGFLTDDTGLPYGNAAPVNQAITFKIYAAPTGDAPHLWGESQVVTIDKGHFSVLLGLGSAVGNRPPLYDVFTGADASSRWMELTVDTKVISPRIQFFAAPYAQLARVANELASDTGDITSTGTIQTTGNIVAGDVIASGEITGASMDLGTGIINSGSIESSGLIRSEGGLSSGTGVVTPYLEVNGNLVQENGNFTSSGNITGKAITGTRLSLGNGTIASGDISGKRLIGTSLSLGSGIINSGPIYAAGEVKGTGPLAALTFDPRINLWGGTWQFRSADSGINLAGLRWSMAELVKIGGSSTVNFLKVNAALQATSYSNISDERFKKVYGISKAAEDLSILKNIKIQNYEWIENKKLEKKIIAQQVQEVYPQAVSISPGYSLIPNISSKAANVHYDNSSSELHIVMDKPHALAVGDSIGMRVGKGFLKEKKVIQITDKSTFVVSSAESYDDIFVVGKHVNDVLSVDYDAIAMLNVSATQELARQAEELESRVRDLEARERRVALLEKDLEAKQSRMEAFEKRLDALDKRLVSVSPQIDRNTEGLQVSVSTGSSR